jgi:hypothetical protein
MPEPFTATTVTAAASFPTTLLLMFFITPPAKVPMGEHKVDQEKKVVWTLQSTSQIQTPSPEVCLDLGNKMISEVDPVNNLTIRAYCLCPIGDGKICLNSTDAVTSLNAKPIGGTVQRIGPKTPTHFTPNAR